MTSKRYDRDFEGDLSRQEVSRVLPVMHAFESALLASLTQGDAAAFDALYERYSARLMRFLINLTRQRALAEDLFQETWLKLATGAQSLEPGTRVYAWLLRVARNAWISRLRKDHGVALLAEWDEQLDLAPLPDARFEARELERGLGHALDSLSGADRELLLLVGMEGLSHEEVAPIVGATVVALRQRLSRARARLQTALMRGTKSPTAGANAGPARQTKGAVR